MFKKFEVSSKSLTNAFSWSFMSETCIKLIQPASYFILMLILSPAEMGLMASALIVTSFSQIFWEAGLGKELIRRDENLLQAANFAFFTNVTIAILLSLLIIILPHSITNMLDNGPDVHKILKIMTIYMILASLSSVQIALLQKKLDFKGLAVVKLSHVMSSAFISVFLAYNGYGVWSLVFGALVGQLVQLITSYKVSDWRPGPEFGDKSLHLDILKFSAWVFLSSILIWFFAWADSLIVGLFFGIENMGLYRSASILAAGFFGLILSPIIPVLYSSLSKLKTADIHTRTANILVNGVILLALPLSWALFWSGSYIENELLSDRWKGFAVIFSMLSIMHGYAWIVGYNGEFFRAKGKPELETLVTGVSMLFYSIAYVLAAKINFETFINVRVMLALIAVIFHLYLLNKVIELNLKHLISNLLSSTFICLGIFVVADYLIPVELKSSTLWLISIILPLVVSYGLLYLFRINSFFLFVKKELKYASNLR